VLTRAAAWFTDSLRERLIRVPIGSDGALGDAAEVRLTGDFAMAGHPFLPDLNGIEATADGRKLIVVNTGAGKLYTVEPSSGVTDEIDLVGGDVAFGDGILLRGNTLYVVQNFLNRIAVIELSPDLRTGTIVTHLTDASLDIPTTVAGFGSRLYAVNARFTAPGATDYWITQLRPHDGSEHSDAGESLPHLESDSANDRQETTQEVDVEAHPDRSRHARNPHGSRDRAGGKAGGEGR
jgi:hypothetical protein